MLPCYHKDHCYGTIKTTILLPWYLRDNGLITIYSNFSLSHCPFIVNMVPQRSLSYYHGIIKTIVLLPRHHKDHYPVTMVPQWSSVILHVDEVSSVCCLYHTQLRPSIESGNSGDTQPPQWPRPKSVIITQSECPTLLHHTIYTSISPQEISHSAIWKENITDYSNTCNKTNRSVFI